MRYTIYGKNYNVSEDVKDQLKKKLRKFDRYFGEDTEVYATFGKQKKKDMLEVTIPLKESTLRAEETADDILTAIELVVDKLEGQLRKHKTKLQRQYSKDNSYHFELLEEDFDDDDEDIEDDAFKIVRTKKFPIKPMNEKEAVMQMDMLGHNFFVFLNADTNDVNVVYKRKDGYYGLIEPYV